MADVLVLPALIGSLYIVEGVFNTPLETMKLKKQLRAVNRTLAPAAKAQNEVKPVGYLNGHSICFLRSLVNNFVTLFVEYRTGFTGVLGPLAGAVASHPLDTIRTRMAISSLPIRDLAQEPFAGVGWSLIRAVPLNWLHRLFAGLLATLFGQETPSDLVRCLAFALATVSLAPLDFMRHMDQSALVTVAASSSSSASAVSAPSEAYATESGYRGGAKRQPSTFMQSLKNAKRLLFKRPSVLWSGSLWSFVEAVNIVVVRAWVVQILFLPLALMMYSGEPYDEDPNAGAARQQVNDAVGSN
eukprot:TRINITY_DN22720_c0_g1_i1.p1 TRINITY_DN22720_c0_g1~~TRINITY_DN22720_c0_g1_i1.p1  ORF type:complete len:320 (-),score=67.72 TRINITY_DN22720_c0_g1_i1:470-1369(-)